jgi:hypothetical protein
MYLQVSNLIGIKFGLDYISKKFGKEPNPQNGSHSWQCSRHLLQSYLMRGWMRFVMGEQTSTKPLLGNFPQFRGKLPLISPNHLDYPQYLLYITPF